MKELKKHKLCTASTLMGFLISFQFFCLRKLKASKFSIANETEENTLAETQFTHGCYG